MSRWRQRARARSQGGSTLRARRQQSGAGRGRAACCGLLSRLRPALVDAPDSPGAPWNKWKRTLDHKKRFIFMETHLLQGVT